MSKIYERQWIFCWCHLPRAFLSVLLTISITSQSILKFGSVHQFWDAHCYLAYSKEIMNPKFWLSVAFLMSRIAVFQAAAQCQPAAEYSIRGMFLRGHTFKTYKIEWHESCYFRCAEEVTCQSYNYVIGQSLCELNNRTKEARPEDFKPDQTGFYMKRAKKQRYTSIVLICVCLFSNAAILNATT